MRIISQDGLFDLPYGETMLQGFYDGKIVAFSLNDLSSNNFITMAKYSTNEKAKKVMEMCREKYLSRMELDELAEEVGELANQGWIPCSERLPEDGQTVLAYIGGRHNSCNYLCACHTVEEYTDRWRNARTGFAILCEVIAWMPLPEPYKEDKDE
ncbi:DUF551 domain-containing protein [[Ruminococcus] lactaris]|uniref:DUF551 domain-containing protein n=1 Tax=[Ruminococcus] lactaris TaxID=46228 RepID=UPI0026DC609F|nr:DUF551 domain-containing protein [[Ruminococcus] lactaris]